jgi:hypothetical protein
MDDGNMSRATKGRVEDVFKNARRVISGSEVIFCAKAHTKLGH